MKLLVRNSMNRAAFNLLKTKGGLAGSTRATPTMSKKMISSLYSSYQPISSSSSSFPRDNSSNTTNVNTLVTDCSFTKAFVHPPRSMNLRQFATTALQVEQEQQEQPKFRALSADVAERIRAEFESVDFNNDGKIDSNELKQLLRKHKDIFREAEILEIAELYYVGNSAKSIPFDTLLQAIDDTLTQPTKTGNRRRNVLEVGSCAAEYYYDVNHHQWKKDELDIQLSHVEPKTFSDRLALAAVKGVRLAFDTMTGWNGEITQSKVLQRVIFLETIAAVPGMTAAIIRHFKSLRHMERDGGLINMFLEEATNERMHLLTFVTMRDPSLAFRAAVIGSQFGFGTGFLVAYLISPKLCHRFVGYVEEEACSTYTKIIDAIENSPEGSELAAWGNERAPKIALSYWHLGENGTVLDLMYSVRADEAEHRDVNHSVVQMQPGDVNPRYDPSVRIDQALNKYVLDMMTRAPKEERAMNM